MTIKQFQGGTAPLVDDDGAGGHVPLAMATAVRHDVDAAEVPNGQSSPLHTDAGGRLKVAAQPGDYPATVGAITTSTASNPASRVAIDVSRASNLAISMAAASLAGHNANFEYSNNSTNGVDGNWYQVQAVRSNANTVETSTGVLAATPVYGWELSVNAYKWFRVQAIVHTGGTATYTLQPGGYATEPIPAGQPGGTQTVAGAVNQGTAAAPGTGGAGAWPVRSAAHRTVDVALAALTAVGQTLSTSIDVSGNVGAHAITVDVTAKGGTNPRLFCRLQGSFDNTNWLNIYDSAVLTTEVAANKLAGHCPLIPIEFPWIRYARDLRGTSPSVTNSVTRMTRPGVEGVRQRRLNDRVLSLTAIAGTTSTEWLYVAGCNRLQLSSSAIASMTTAAGLKVQVCEADPGNNASWVDLPGATLTLSAGARTLSPIFEIASTMRFARRAVVTPGVAITADTYELAMLAWEV